MALTRAQLLMGNSSQGPVLAGQVQAVRAGAGISIDSSGVISVDSTTVTGLVKLNNPAAYNSYIWPNVDGAYGSFLQTNSVGALSWKNPAFVGTTAPTPASDGMLWYDCNSGYLKVYQSCVAPNGWTKVAEPGLPVLTTSMSAFPAFSSGSGTLTSPYIVATSTVVPGDSVLILNTITVTGLAPNQYVSIIDENAVINGGRYRFTNTFANAAGNLIFNIIFTDAPDSVNGTNYTALIRVGYATGYIRSNVSVITTLSISSPGTISGTAAGGSTLTYTTGSATGGTPPYTYAWVWKKASDDSVLQTNGATYVIPGSLIGDRVYITLTATDSVSATASGDTTDYPGAPAVIVGAPFPNWAVAAPTQIPQVVSGAWSDGATAITSTNCIQISLDGVTFGQGPLSVSNGTTLYMQWEPTGASCGGAPSGTTITGTITNGTFTNSYSLTLDRNPDAFTFTDLTGQALSTAITSNSITISGTNCPAYIIGTSPTLTSVQVSVAGAGFVSLPTSGTTVTVNPGATVQIQGTTGASNSTGYAVTASMGTTSDTWTVTTSALVPTVAQPSITAPIDGTTGVNPGVNCTPGVALVASAFSSSNGAGTDHVSSDWQVATDSGFSTIVFSATADTVNKTSIFVPRANLTFTTTYYCRVRYTSGTAGGGVVTTSAYSASTYDWQTSASFVPPVANAMCGGYFGGQIKVFAGEDGGGLPTVDTIYNLIVAPITSGSLEGQLGGASGTQINWKLTNTGDPAPPTDNMVYGGPISELFKNDASYPLFNTFLNGSTGPNAGAFDLATGGAGGGTGIGGYNDWYIPAKYEFNIVYFFLKPTTQANNVANPNLGNTPNSLPPFTPNTVYGPGFPNQTTSPLFQSTGAEAFLFAPNTIYYATTSQTTWAPYIFRQKFDDGSCFGGDKYKLAYSLRNWARAIRRVLAA